MKKTSSWKTRRVGESGYGTQCSRSTDFYGHHPQFVLSQGFLHVVLQWRAWLPECSVRAGRGSQPTFWFETWTLQHQATADGLKSSAWRCLGVFSSRWTTLVSLLHADGSTRPGALRKTMVPLRVARRRKERRYPELSGHHEVGGRWSDETRTFIRRFKARTEPQLLRKRVEQVWRLRWSLLSCAAWTSVCLVMGTSLRLSGTLGWCERARA